MKLDPPRDGPLGTPVKECIVLIGVGRLVHSGRHHSLPVLYCASRERGLSAPCLWVLCDQLLQAPAALTSPP